MEYKKHKFNILPEMTDIQFNRLKEKLKNGYDKNKEPIFLFENEIIDGWHRYKACKELGINAIFKEYIGSQIQAMDFVFIQNERRDLTDSQRDYLIGKEYEHEKKKVGRNWNNEVNFTPLKTSEKLAEKYNISEKSVKNNEQFAKGIDVINEIAPEKKNEILNDESELTKKEVQSFATIKDNTKSEIKQAEKDIKENAFFKTEEQIKLEIKKRADEIEQRAKEIAAEKLKQIEVEKQVKKEEKIQQRTELIEKQKKEIAENKLPELNGLYNIISVDPPWNYGREYDPETSRVANPYPEMTIDEIKTLKLPFTENAIVFLWTTHKFLPEAFEILKTWGFEYKATLVWNKEKIGMGAWFRMQCEFCLFAIKGKPFWNNTTERDIIIESRREHSRKPDSFFEMVNKICVGRKLEYFAREKREGWDIFGNDTNKF